MARFLTASLLILATACASQTATTNPGRPELVLIQRNEIFFGSGTTAPITIGVQLKNVAAEPIVIRRIRLEPGLMTQYTVRPREELYNHALPPGDARSVEMVLMAVTQMDPRRFRQSEPLALRARVDYEYQGKKYREIWVNPTVR